MIFKTTLARLAIIDLEKIIEYYVELNRKTAENFYINILKKIKKLKEFPRQGRIVPEFEDLFSDMYREIIFENYRIIYKIEGEEIIVIRIVDSRRLLDVDYI